MISRNMNRWKKVHSLMIKEHHVLLWKEQLRVDI